MWGQASREEAMSQPKGYVDTEYLDVAAERVRQFKQLTYRLMHVEPGHRVLDVGCGPGTDTVPLAQIVGSTGQVVGLDYDKDMIAEADRRAERAGVRGWVQHECGDATSLPFESDRFDSVRSERMFQHLTEPERALSEIVRVTRPGGWIVVADADWSTLSFDTPEFEVEQTLKRFIVEHGLHSALAGRQLYRMFRQQHLLEISIDMTSVYLTDYAAGRHFCSATGAALSGRKP
jgi:ubiquinone/menaquinone biosynthesis C-methylase UbiE